LVFAQSGVFISWDKSVGCVDYEDQMDEIYDVLIPLESIEDSKCVKFCRNSSVLFTLNDPNNQVSSMTWSQSGGQALSGNSNLNFPVLWNNSTGAASINIDVTYNDGTVVQQNLCVEVIETPVANFTFLGGNGNRCEGDFQTINTSFDPSGSALISHEWIFTNANGTTLSSSQKVPQIYLTPGNWTAQLTVTNECNCSDTTQTSFNVSGTSVEITCPTVVCENATETYTLENIEGCESYNWDVEGGTILGGANTGIVEVLWDNPQNGFGILSFDQEGCNSCSNSYVYARIPVISETVGIEGETNLCGSEQYLYSMPQWPSVEFEWSLTDLSGNPVNASSGFIITDQPNEMVLDTSQLDNGSYLLTCNYDSPLLLCGGNATLQIDVKVQHEIIAPENVCLGEPVTLSTVNMDSSTQWSVYYNNAIITQHTGSTLNNYIFQNVGRYTITASSSNYCLSDEVVINSEPTPPAIDQTVELNGELTEVCPDSPYTYSIDLANDLYYPEWRINGTNASITGSTTGNAVSITFDAILTTETYTVEVRQVSKENGCLGPWKSYTITPITRVLPDDLTIFTFNPAAPNTLFIAENRNYCPSSSTMFKVDYDAAETYRWFFDDAAYGSIVQGQNTNEVEVRFNDVPENLPNRTNLNVEIRKCNTTYTVRAEDLIFDGYPISEWVLRSYVELCSGDNHTVSIPANDLPGSFDINSWDYEVTFHYRAVNVNFEEDYQGSVWSLDVNGNLVIDIPDLPQPTRRTSFFIFITLLDDIACDPPARNSYAFYDYLSPAPDVSISTAGATTVCDVADIDVTLSAVLQNANVGPASYQWFKNGVSLAGNTGVVSNSSDLVITPGLGLGSYSCELVFSNNNPLGCNTASQSVTIDLIDCTGNGGAGDSCDNHDIDITSIDWTNCGEIQVTVTNYGDTPSFVTYEVSGSSWNIVTSNLTTATLTTTEPIAPGTYNVNVSAAYAGCTAANSLSFTVGYQAEVITEVECNPNGGYDVTLGNLEHVLASYLPTTTVLYEIVGFNGSSTTNTDTVTFNNVPAGTYTARLTISSTAGDPTCISTETLTLTAGDASFTILDANNPQPLNGSIATTCAECPILLQPNTINPDHTYRWKFLDIASNSQTSPTMSLPQDVNSEITLIVTDEYGCESETTQSIVVVEGVFIGAFNGDGVYCEGDIIDLSYFNTDPQTIAPSNSVNPAESGYLWMLGTEPAPGVNTDPTYRVTTSGQYWVKLRNTSLCLDDIDAINVTVLPKPFFDIKLPQAACVGQPYQVKGIVPQNGAGISRYRWTLDNSVSSWNTTFPITPLEELWGSAGSHTYKLEIETDQGCVFELEKVVTVQNEPVINSINISLDTCSPYKVNISTTANQAGTFYWSNGDEGSSISVTRGGAYQVTFVPDNSACSVTSNVFVPKDPSTFLWYFPSGCLEYCPKKNNPNRYIPSGTAWLYSWSYGWNPSGSFNGTDQVQDLDLTNFQGSNVDLDLTLNNFGCSIKSKPLKLRNSEECAECGFEFEISKILKFNEPYTYYEIYGQIVNSTNTGVSVDLAILGQTGYLSPSTIFVPANSTYVFGPMLYIPQDGFGGGTVLIALESLREGNPCYDEHKISFPEELGGESEERSSLHIVPNPVDSKTNFLYRISDTIDKDTTLQLFDLNGLLHFEQDLEATTGEFTAHLDTLKPGQYLVIIKSGGVVLIRKYLIKK
jgi:hypothetical protein